MLTVREEQRGDRDAVREVNREAFGQDAEADIVDKLRANGNMTLSLVAEQDGRINQVITVRDLEFSTPLKAQVTGRGTVRIQ